MSKVTLTTNLPISAETACALAHKPEFLNYSLRPFLRVTGANFLRQIEVGAHGSVRFWFLGIIPSWAHHVTVSQAEETEIYTNENGGPIRTWNHRLTFAAIDKNHCRYTDEIETDDGWRGLPTRLLIRLLFRYRHRRWQGLARILA